MKRNKHSPKTLKSQSVKFQTDIPKDRECEFKPKLNPKYQLDVFGTEEKMISLYVRGMSTRNIHDQIQDLYGDEAVSRNAQQVLAEDVE